MGAGLLLRYPYIVTHVCPLPKVLKGLAPALDDPKRAVRKEAGRCKRAW